MRPSSTTASVGVGVLLLLAWLAAAVSVPEPPRPPPRDPPPSDSEQLSGLRASVRMQSARLRDRLSAAPAPRPAVRNPFRFVPKAAAGASPGRFVDAPVAAPLPGPATPPDPLSALILIGFAERREDGALVRTAIITGPADALHLVREGDAIDDGYRVRAVGAGFVELEDVATGATRRLVLQ